MDTSHEGTESVPPRAERWTICRAGHVHWGVLGGAGFLFRYHAGEGGVAEYLLAQRSRSVDNGGSWGVPGGATRASESAEETARRETLEEIGTLPEYRVTSVDVQDCGGGWIFHLFCADVEEEFTAYCGQETDATGWFTEEMIRSLPRHPDLRLPVDH